MIKILFGGFLCISISDLFVGIGVNAATVGPSVRRFGRQQDFGMYGGGGGGGGMNDNEMDNNGGGSMDYGGPNNAPNNRGKSKEDEWDRLGMGWRVKPRKHRISLDGKGKTWRTQPVNPYMAVLQSKWLQNPFKMNRKQPQQHQREGNVRGFFLGFGEGRMGGGMGGGMGLGMGMNMGMGRLNMGMMGMGLAPWAARHRK